MSDVVAKSGITTDAKTGERYIPASVRPDGSKRKEIRVRPGYKPPEDIELYKNRAAAAWKTRAKGGVPGAEALSSEEDKAKVAPKPATAAAVPTTASSNKNAKRREAKRNAKDADGVEGKGIDSNNWRAPPAPTPAPALKEEQPVQEPVNVEAEKEKKARNLKKKLRQARDLREKKEQGEGLLPEQLDKIIKIQELVRQLDVLGFDSNGDKKTGESSEDA
ncbi:Exon junction complex Pym [Penicillium soppii]|jgi:partner of Y14 and mago protein|uniref:Exon junction complex Pym n=1 Tax=Penicillium soppii TaxID=69789 RepID=UPI0025466FD8|nr:Exon junction complex Pym [Penicillium soppii]KAJ5856061.1 Exon junction complex Pym [Penicillium soppii]